MGDFIFKAIGVVFIGGLLLGLVAFCNATAIAVLMPVSIFVSKVTGFIVKPLTALWDLLMKGVDKLKSLVLKNKPENYAIRTLGGLELVVWISFCLAVIVFTLFYSIFIAKIDLYDVEESIMFSLPVFSIFALIIEGSFSIDMVFEFSLFAFLTITFMRRTQELKIIVRVVYDLIFTFFSTCLIFWLPKGWYSFTFDIIKNLPQLADTLGNLHIFGFIILILVLIIVAYLTIVLFSITIRELLATVAFSLIPFSIMIVAVVILGMLNLPSWLFSLLGYIAAIAISIAIGYVRMETEDIELD